MASVGPLVAAVLVLVIVGQALVGEPTGNRVRDAGSVADVIDAALGEDETNRPPPDRGRDGQDGPDGRQGDEGGEPSEPSESAQVIDDPLEGGAGSLFRDLSALAGAGGQVYEVADASQWEAAVGAAEPGDVIRLTRTINQRLEYRGVDFGGHPSGKSGTAEAPIVITADPGVWIDPGDLASNKGALDVLAVDHVHVVNVNIRNSQFGLRCHRCRGTAARPVRIEGNRVENIGHAAVHIGAPYNDRTAHSQYVVVARNRVTRTGQLDKQYGEGIYLGYGSVEWIDETANITVANNHISHTTAEAIDIKPGTRDILVEGNRIHDVAPIYGGAISAHFVNAAPNPKPSELDQVTIRNNRIWNHNLSGASKASDSAIWVGHGGISVTDNMMWGFRTDSNAQGVRLRALQSFGPHEIRIENNLFWIEQGWVRGPGPSRSANVVARNNRGPDVIGVEIVLTAADLGAGVPRLGQGGDADSGGGPGSAFKTAMTVTRGADSDVAPTRTPAPAPAPATGSQTPESVVIEQAPVEGEGSPEAKPLAEVDQVHVGALYDYRDFAQARLPVAAPEANQSGNTSDEAASLPLSRDSVPVEALAFDDGGLAESNAPLRVNWMGWVLGGLSGLLVLVLGVRTVIRQRHRGTVEAGVVSGG